MTGSSRKLHSFESSFEQSYYSQNEKPNKETDDMQLTPYELLRPKNESAFLNYLRSWEKRIGFQTPIIYVNAISITLANIALVIWIIAMYAIGPFPLWQTVIYGFFVGGLAGFGVTGGAHRYWTHRSYKAKLPLQIILLACYTIAGQNTLPEWVRDHRVHHKYSETSADPHDANRGFWFAHVGWLMMRKHPDVVRKGKQMDFTDITRDPLIQFHTKYFTLLKVVFCFALPAVLPALCWHESWRNSVCSQVIMRYMLSLNCTWSVNSFAHLYGYKPYDRTIMPVQNLGVSLISGGEGWHNYHHTFPWDYKTAELPYAANFTTLVIDAFRLIGWAYDVKQASPRMIQAAIEKSGGEMKTAARML